MMMDEILKMGLKEIRFGGMDWIDLGKNKDQWMALLNFKDISSSMKCWEFLRGCATGGLSRRAQLHEARLYRAVSLFTRAISPGAG
jgi:hypothetical protein